MRAWHFSENAYPYLPPADEYPSIRVTLPNRIYDPEKGAALYDRFLDEWLIAEDEGMEIMLNEQEGGFHRIPQLFKAARGITVGPAHYQYSLPDGRRLWCCHNETVEQFDAWRDVVLEHRTRERSEAREARRWAYYLRRDSQQMEVPDLDPGTAERLLALGLPVAPGAIGAVALAAGPQVAPESFTAPH